MQAVRWFSGIGCLMVASFFGFAGCQPAEEPEEEPAAQEPMAESDEERIRALADRYASAWNEGDAAAVAELYALDGDLVGVEGRVHEGRAEVLDRMSEDFDGIFQGTEITITTDSVRLIEPEIALVDGTFTITGMTGPDGEAMDPLEGRYSNIVVEHGGEWQLEAVRPMVPQPVAAAESPESQG